MPKSRIDDMKQTTMNSSCYTNSL